MSLVLNVEILGEFKKLTAATQGAQNSLANLQKRAGRVARGISRIVGALGISLGLNAVINGFKDAVEASSDLEQQFGGLDSVFKETSGEMKAFAKDMNRIGLSSAEAARQSVLLGSMIKGAGFSLKDTGKQTKSLITLAGDLAATFGGPTSEAVRAISALLRNEYNPIERYGVSIKKSDINARLAAEGLDKLTGEALKQAEVQAGLSLLFEKTADAQGQAARESETYAAKMGELKARFTDVQAEIGIALIPALIKVSEWFIGVIPDIQRFFKTMMEALANPRVKEAFSSLDKSLGGLGKSIAQLFGMTTTQQAVGFVVFFETIARLLAGIVQTVDLMVQSFKNAFPVFNTFSNLVNGIAQGLVAISGYTPAALPTIPSSPTNGPNITSNPKQNVTININKGNVTAKEIAKAVNKGTKTGGAPILTGIALRKALK
jgi:hypothetical protein